MLRHEHDRGYSLIICKIGLRICRRSHALAASSVPIKVHALRNRTFSDECAAPRFIMSILGSKSDGPAKVGPDIIEHWYTLVSGMHFPVSDFYIAVSEELKAHQLPGLVIKTVSIAEGGPLSDNRLYLRMKRERLYFDVCAAPFGLNFFFSYRFYYNPPVITLWDIAAILDLVVVPGGALVYFLGWIGAMLVVPALCVLAVFAMKAVGESTPGDVDKVLMMIPGIGPIYEMRFRKDTYYRQDTRIAYCSVVSAIVKERVQAMTSAKGVWLRREYLYSPLFEGMYHARNVETGAPVQPR